MNKSYHTVMLGVLGSCGVLCAVVGGRRPGKTIVSGGVDAYLRWGYPLQ
jgi:hypothetical protein